MRRCLRWMLLLPVLVAMVQGAALEVEFERTIRPVLKQYCLVCHSAEKHAGDLNLERFGTMAHVLRDPRPWQKAVEQINLGEMPPKGMPPLPAGARTQLLTWMAGALDAAARQRAGDPGPVILRRLNNAEYTYTIRDLTGVPTLDPVRDFPADGAAGEGFMNTGAALAMSPALAGKYLDAAKRVAAHAMLLPDGIRFSPHTSRSDRTNATLAAIREFYAAHTVDGGADTVTQQGIALDKNRGGTLPLKRYLTAANELRGGKQRVESVAQRHGLSPKYLALLAGWLERGARTPVSAGLREHWPLAKPDDADKIIAEVAQWQNALWKFNSVGHVGKVDGPKSWMEAVTPVVAKQEFRFKLEAPKDASAIPVFLAAHDAGDGPAGDVVVWREPRLALPGRDPVPLRILPALVGELAAQRTRIFAVASGALNAIAAGGAAPMAGTPERAWFDFLAPALQPLTLMTRKIEKSGDHDFVQGWGAAQGAAVLANSTDRAVRVPGSMKPKGVALHPSPTHQTAIGWLSPVAATLRIDGALVRAHAECGNGVTWAFELRRGRVRMRLAGGEIRGRETVAIGPLEGVRVERGDLLSLLIGPRDANHSCDLTDAELNLASGAETWSLKSDLTGEILAANPHPDATGRPGVWHFYTEPVAGAPAGVPAQSALGRWLVAGPPEIRRELASSLQALLAGATAPSADDAALLRQLSPLAGPLFAGISAPENVETNPAWGLDPGRFGRCPDGAAGGRFDLCVQAPAVVEFSLPVDLVAGSELMVTGELHPISGAEGTVQLEAGAGKALAARTRLMPAGTTIGDAKGTWSSNNQTVDFALPVIARPQSASRRRVEAEFQDFRQLFPASLCYTRIVPVDEVLTLTLFHREDEHLARLLLDDRRKAQLDQLWDQLHYVSRDALTLVDAFEQLWQYATQDADPSKFEPLRQPIQARAEAFRKLLAASEPRHLESVIEFAGRAQRRPMPAAAQAELRGLYRQLRDRELPHEDAIRLMIARVLASPGFLYRIENPAAGTRSTPVDPYQMASRLSYFLWSSQPDSQLMDAAASGRLNTPAGVRAEARRLLHDPRVRRLATEFGTAWLHVHGFDTMDEKSEQRFPDFRARRSAMYEETIRFITDLFQNDGSVLSIVESKHTFLNAAMAEYYGVPGVQGEDWRRVEGVDRYGRGGVLTHASILAKQAGASRTSPILRGNWISEVLLGARLPRPPKDVPPLPSEEVSGTLSMREITERHTRDARCSGCHLRIDPYGFTLERYDAVGRFRDREPGGAPIHDQAQLRDGTVLDGAAGLRRHILGPGRRAFLRQFCAKLLGYALGRAVTLSDEPLITAMWTALEQNDYHAGKAIDLIVASRQFREIRGRDHEPDEQ
ncbi:MAG: DUF1592 domain-containing protein [Acidobacteria bacterium]|nr:DUF1592 domain-containing protein [Acidobacteriota bacterium]